MARVLRLGVLQLLALVLVAYCQVSHAGRNDSPYQTRSQAAAAQEAAWQADLALTNTRHSQCVTNFPPGNACGDNNPRQIVVVVGKAFRYTYCVTNAPTNGSVESCSLIGDWVWLTDDNPCQALAGSAPGALTCSGDACSHFNAGGTADAPPAGPMDVVCMDNGCLVQGVREVSWWDDKLKLWGTHQKLNRYTGATCSASEYATPGSIPSQGTVTATPTITDDHIGKCPGTVNGIEVWKPCGTVTQSTPTTTTKTNVVTNPDGSTTTTNTVTGATTNCKDGQCVTTTTGTTTVTVSTPGGSSTSTVTASGGSSSGGLGEFCKTNPKSPVCGDGSDSTFGGSCSTAFACTGDAVMCAAAKAVNETKCGFFVTPATSQEALLYGSNKGNGTATGIVSSTVALSSASFDQANALGVAGQCIPDLVVTVWGKSVTLPISQVCPQLLIAGQLLLAVSFLLAIRIVGRG